MELQKIIDYINKPGNLDQAQKEELYRYIKQYPFCATFHVLWLKSLKNTGHHEFQKMLQESAMFIHNRPYFYDWVHTFHKKVDKETVSIDNDTAKQKSEGYTEQEKETYYQERLRQIEKEQDFSGQQNPEKTTFNKESSDTSYTTELIDKFMQNEPRIIPDKEKDYSEEAEVADQSLKDDHEFISETLAMIYQRQGKINKAIEIYQKLSLKFPEKKRYFANLIEELKKK
ncbi:MAG: hypothetical protein K9H84_00195 [Bacteroidales bacterium]|nr:hypothetical protein [Bacteroidales bacterium]